MHFIIFERNVGHCVIELVQAGSLREALTIYAMKVFTVQINSAGDLLLTASAKNAIYMHPLEFIENNCKSESKFDELQWDDKRDQLLNGSSWEIRLLPEQAWNANYAEVFCSSSPWSLGEYIRLCRPVLRQDFPRSRARAFVWYLQDGPLVTFYRRRDSGETIEIIERYIIPWQRDKYPNPYTLDSNTVEKWQGTYDDLLTQIKIEYLF